MVDSFLVGSYISVPQIGNDALFDQQSDLARAVASIPAYIGLCSHFFAIPSSMLCHMAYRKIKIVEW